MTGRWWRAVALVGVVLPLASCGLGTKQTLADRVTDAAKRLDDAGGASGTIAAEVALVKSDKPAVPGPPKIIAGKITEVPAVFDLEHRRAAVGVKDDDPSTAVLVFRGSDMFQRIAPKTTSVQAAVLSAAAANLDPLVAAYHGVTLTPATAPAGAVDTATTTTTVVHTALRRASRIPREWIGFDFAGLDEKETAKRAGSLAINPVILLDLAKGVLTGSIRRGPVEGGLVRYDANVNRDKAERHLSEDDRELIDKIFKANAVSGRTFRAHVWLDRLGALRRFQVRLRQQLTSVDRADLTVTIDLAATRGDLRIGPPDRRATATVGSLGQLVTAVSRA